MFSPEDYTIIAAWLPRLLGAIYFFAFWPFLFQIKGLIGSHGILPAERYLNWIKRAAPSRCYWICPTFFWLNASNNALVGLVALGCVLSILLMLGFFPSLLLLCLYLLYLSIISVGQDFLSFGWEVFLQEVTLLTFFMSLTSVPNLMIWISINFLLFRFYLQSGAVKLQSRDKTWKNLTAIAYHYQTQPIANLTAWYVHKLPMWFHKVSCVIMYAIELVVPFFIFFTEEIRLVTCALLLSLQLLIYTTGNFSYLNHLSVVFTLILLNDSFLIACGFTAPPISPTPWLLDFALSIVGSALLVLQMMRLWDHFFPNPRFHRTLNMLAPLHIANRYGIFAIMTTTRFEVVVEGSNDGSVWKEYDFYHKPTDLKRRPSRISPYQPRIDWQAWFLPFRPFDYEIWFQNFLIHLLRGTPDVLYLLRYNPFVEKPPTYIRARLYIYTFSDFKEKRETGNWWHRMSVGSYSPTFSLRT